MRYPFDEEDDSADDPMHEARLQALADMVDARDMMEKGGVLANILLRAFNEAKEALADLVEAPTTDENIRALQYQVKRYGDLVKWTRDIINEGKDAAKELGSGQMEELSKIVRGENSDDYQD